jgi:hypothetical protein
MEVFKNSKKSITILIIFDLFRYLYDNDTDSADDWTDYNDVERYLLKNGYTEEQIHEEFKKAMDDRDKN